MTVIIDSAFNRGTSSFNIELLIPANARITNVSIETTTAITELFAKVELRRIDGETEVLVSTLGSGTFYNTGSFAVPLSINTEAYTSSLFPCRLKAAIRNETGLNPATTMYVTYEVDDQ